MGWWPESAEEMRKHWNDTMGRLPCPTDDAFAECPRCGEAMPADAEECQFAKCVAFREWATTQPQDETETVDVQE